MAASPTAKTIHGASTIRSLPVIRVASLGHCCHDSVHPVVVPVR